MKDGVNRKTNRKTEIAVNFVKPKLNQKPQFFCKTEQKTEPKSFFLPTAHPYLTSVIGKILESVLKIL